jgi:photosystem II stability/assembly factor-like uncharacterized protein
MFESCRAHFAVIAAAALAVVLAALAAAAGATAQADDARSYYPVAIGRSHVGVIEHGARRSRLLRVPGFRDITPWNMPLELDDVEFLDGRTGWLAANDCALGRGLIARTRDGGRSWRGVTTAFSHGCAAGSRLDVAFADPRHGWLVNLQPTGPGASLYRTRDGGRTWQTLRAERSSIRRVVFTSASTGWGTWAPPPGAGAPLFRSADGGVTWVREEQLPAGRYELPVFRGPSGVVVAAVRWSVLVYLTGDGGRRWTPAGRLRFGEMLYEPSVSSPAAGVWWITAFARRRTFLAVTADGGRSWTRREVDLPGGASFALVATSGRAAWASQGGRLYRTGDAGRTWTRVRPR